MPDRDDALQRDEADPLARVRDEFVVADDGLVYLDGNSLGRLPRATVSVSRDVVERQWGERLIRGWHDWVTLPLEVGDELAPLIGARPGEVLVCDTTTTNLFKLATAALQAAPGRPDVVTDDDNFPTDRFVLDRVARAAGGRVRVLRTHPDRAVDTQAVAQALDDRVGLVSLSHVAYRSGALAPQAEIDALAHAAGARTLWDLSHSAGSVEVDLSTADLAVGCTYKYLNAGPGAPGYLYVRRDLLDGLENPVPGWFGAADQFAMAGAYAPRDDVGRFLTGTPDVAGLLRVRSGTAVLARPGIAALAAKGRALTAYLVDLVADLPLRVASPLDPRQRGAHVVLEHPQAWQLTQALVDRGVVPDYRTPDRIRFGAAAAYTRYVDVWDGVHALRQLLECGDHLRYPADRAAVT